MKKEYYSFGGVIKMRKVPEHDELLHTVLTVYSEEEVERMTCDCCTRHISELRPFGKAGDPLKGDFEGAYIVKVYRDYDGWAEKSWECRDCIILSNDDALNKYEKNHPSGSES